VDSSVLEPPPDDPADALHLSAVACDMADEVAREFGEFETIVVEKTDVPGLL
jgi:hypothetical protein